MPPRSSRTCDVPGCGGKHRARGYCNAHLSRLRKWGDIRADLPVREPHQKIEGKTCLIPRCGKDVRCRGFCSGHYYQVRTYRLSDERAIELLGAETCSICDEPGALVIDHDHDCCTGKNIMTCGNCVRGAICDLCNKGLGHFRDNPKLLARAARYLGQINTDA